MSIKKGVYAASMTVINKDLSVNVDSTIKHSERLIQQGCHGVVIGGSTGMSQLISSNEKRKLIDKMSDSKFKENFVFGTGANSINENVQLIKHCIENGINKFLITYVLFVMRDAYLGMPVVSTFVLVMGAG